MVSKWTEKRLPPLGGQIKVKRQAAPMCFADYMTRVMLTRLVATWGVLLGTFFTIGGYDRISSPTFGVIADVPFAPGSWGIPLALVSLVVLIMALQPLTLDRRGKIERRILQIGLFAMAVWNLSFAIAFLVEIFRTPIAAVSGPFTYGMNAAICLVLMVSHRVWDSHVD